MENISRVSISDESFIIHRRNSDGELETIACSEIRGAVTPPTISGPGYYLILAQKAERNESGKKSLLLLAEGESDLQEELFDKLIAAISDYKCQVICLDRRHVNFNYSLAKRLKKYDEIKLMGVHFEEDDDYGLSIIRQWLADKALEIPKDTILARELGKMTSDSISYVVDPLKYLIVGFEMSEKIFSTDFFEEYKKKIEKQKRRELSPSHQRVWGELDRIREQQQEEYETDLFDWHRGIS